MPPSRHSRVVLLDDRLLVALIVGLPVRLPRSGLHTTAYWYYRACRAAVAGAGGHLSGPFAELDAGHQSAAVAALLELPAEVGLPEPRSLVPKMVGIHRRHPRLNLLNVEAAAAALLLGARVLLSPPSAAGVLPSVLDAESVPWAVAAEKKRQRPPPTLMGVDHLGRCVDEAGCRAAGRSALNSRGAVG